MLGSVLLLAACSGQSAPSLGTLPDLDQVIPERQPCMLMVGEPLGALVDDVLPGTAADGAIEPGDVLVGVGGVAVADAEQLRTELQEHAVGDTVAISLIRDGSELSVDVTLQEGDTPGRPQLGVMATTAFDQVAPEELEAEPGGDPLQRAVDVGGLLLVLDSSRAEWGSSGREAPASEWVAAGDQLFRLDTEGEEPQIVDIDSGDAARFSVDNWEPLNLIGSLDGKLLVSVARPLESDPQLAEVGVMLADPASSGVEWLWQVDQEGLGVPIAAYPSPDGSRVLIGTSDAEAGTIHYAVLGANGLLEVAPATLAVADDSLALGWFDADSILVRMADGAVVQIDVASGTGADQIVPASVLDAERMWAVGDGQHVLAQVDDTMALWDLSADGTVRIVADNCVIGGVSDPGWAT
jgi:hypothetical protein